MPFLRLGWVGFITLIGLGSGSARVADNVLREKATNAYQKGQYEIACPLFAELANAAKTNGAYWADLGLCQFRRGQIRASYHASLPAIRYGDATTRKNAAFNLHQAGYEVSVDALVKLHRKQSNEGNVNAAPCLQLFAAAEFECTKGVRVCFRDLNMDGSGVYHSSAELLFGQSAPPGYVEHRTCVPLDESLAYRCVLGRDEICPPPFKAERKCKVIAFDPCRDRLLFACVTSVYGGTQKKPSTIITEASLEPGGHDCTSVEDQMYPSE